jgi:hypothetical protein
MCKCDANKRLTEGLFHTHTRTQPLYQEWYDRVLARRKRLEEAMAAMELPGNPLDMIIHELGGPRQVAESKWLLWMHGSMLIT